MRNTDAKPAPGRAVAVNALRRGLFMLAALLVMCAGPGNVRAVGADVQLSPAEQKFLQALDDVPLMAGLMERPAAGIVFETAAGRIVEAEAESRPAAKLTVDGVMEFYESTLAGLGWRALGGGRFAREDEILSIFTAAAGAGLRVRFSLRPK